MTKAISDQANAFESPQATGNLRGHFLIAMPSLRDPIFAQAITYICEHSREGA